MSSLYQSKLKLQSSFPLYSQQELASKANVANIYTCGF